jgi:hypothetical protein
MAPFRCLEIEKNELMRFSTISCLRTRQRTKRRYWRVWQLRCSELASGFMQTGGRVDRGAGQRGGDLMRRHLSIDVLRAGENTAR